MALALDLTRNGWKGFRFGVWLPLLLGGLLFLGPAYSESFVMDEATYGALVISIPAEVWATCLFGSSLVYMVFLMINGRWKYSWVVRIAAAMVAASKFTLFVVSASQSGGHDIVILFGFAFVVSIFCTIWIDAREVVFQGSGRGGC